MQTLTLMAATERNLEFAAAMERIAAGRSNREIARLLKEKGYAISHTYIGDMRWGNVPTYRMIQRLADGLGLGPDARAELFETANYGKKHKSEQSDPLQRFLAGVASRAEQARLNALETRVDEERWDAAGLTSEDVDSVLSELEQRFAEIAGRLDPLKLHEANFSLSASHGEEIPISIVLQLRGTIKLRWEPEAEPVGRIQIPHKLLEEIFPSEGHRPAEESPPRVETSHVGTEEQNDSPYNRFQSRMEALLFKYTAAGYRIPPGNRNWEMGERWTEEDLRAEVGAWLERLEELNPGKPVPELEEAER